jgi:hypothetical protein
MVQVLLEKHSVEQKEATGKRWKENSKVCSKQLYLCMSSVTLRKLECRLIRRSWGFGMNECR